ncbi:MAG: beta-galactosidase [Micropruina sp.]
MPSSHIASGLQFGAAYYLEYQPTDSPDRDLDLMKAAHFTVIRVGESVWSTWEPRNGSFNLDWLQPVLDGAHARGINVILGTPTYAAPPWLAHAYPEIAGEVKTGQRMPWGARQEIDITHPAFLFHAERIIRKVVARYAGHPAVIGIQVDNEPGAMLLHNRGTFTGFVEWLKDTYGDVETLNREWGLVYWSHRISDWAELWVPDGNLQPEYGLAWRRYQALAVTKFIAWQADIVREYTSPHQFVTTCVAFDRPAMHEQQLNTQLDVAAVNPYYGMQDHLDLGQELARPDEWVRTGVAGLLELADRGFGIAQERFLVTETNAQAIHLAWQNFPPYPGQLKQAGMALVARGAAMIEYWHWHTLHFGVETYWGGVLPHSQRPGRVYHELAELGEVLEGLGERLDGYRPDADATILFSTDSKFAFEVHPPLSNPSGSPRSTSYADIVNAFHAGVLYSGGQARILHAEQLDDLDVATLVASHPLLVAAGYCTADTAALEKLRDYAAAGGHLVLGPRTGYGDEHGRARFAVAPAVLGEAAGVHYEEFSNLREPLPLTSSGMQLSPGAKATYWADGVLVDDAEVLAGYQHPYLGRFPTVTTRAHGEGRITYVGTIPNATFGADLFRHLIPRPIAADWVRDPSVTVLSGTTSAGRVYFVHNWSPDPSRVTVPTPVTELTAETPVEAGQTLDLDPWSVRIFIDR